MKSAELSKKVMSNEIHGMREAVNIILHLLKIECEKIEILLRRNRERNSIFQNSILDIFYEYDCAPLTY